MTSEVEDLGLIRSGLDHLAQGLTIFDCDLRLVAFNEKAREVLGFPDDIMVIGVTIEDLFRYNAKRGEYGEGAIETLVSERMALARRMEPHGFERTRPDGTVIEISGTPLPGGGFVTTYTDVTLKKQAEGELRNNEARLRSALDASPVGVVISRADDSTIVFANPAMLEMVGVSREAFVGSKAGDYYADDGIRRRVARKLAEESRIANEEIHFRRPDGGHKWALVTAQHTLIEGVDHLLTWVYEITEFREAREKLARMAMHDHLTGLANRRQFQDYMESLLSDLRHRGTRAALLYFDLDGFKAVNDTLGHDFGDWLLKEVANRLRACTRKGDLVARMGGDEFAVVIEDAEFRQGEHSKAALHSAERTIRAIAHPFNNEGKGATIGVSIGIVEFDGHVENIDELVCFADRAMYRAKHGGKGTWRFHDPEIDGEPGTCREADMVTPRP